MLTVPRAVFKHIEALAVKGVGDAAVGVHSKPLIQSLTGRVRAGESDDSRPGRRMIRCPSTAGNVQEAASGHLLNGAIRIPSPFLVCRSVALCNKNARTSRKIPRLFVNNIIRIQ